MPYRSKAQWRWGATHFSKEEHEKWARESPPYSQLPERLPNEEEPAPPRSPARKKRRRGRK